MFQSAYEPNSTMSAYFFLLAIFFSWLTFSSIEAASQAKAGPFEIQYHRGGRCPGNLAGKNLYLFEDKIIHHSRSYTYLMVNGSLLFPISDEVTATLKLSVKTSQGWKDNFFSLDVGPACEAARLYLPSLYNDVARSINRKHCPVPVGNYTNVKIDVSNVTIAGIKVMFYNEYRARVFGKYKGEVITCIEGYGAAIPKRSG